MKYIFLILMFVSLESSAAVTSAQESTLLEINATNQQILESLIIIAHWLMAGIGVVVGSFR